MAAEELSPRITPDHGYTEDSIRSLDCREHIRLRPGMYIGKLGDGSAYDDGIYVLVKEVIDNSIDDAKRAAAINEPIAAPSSAPRP